jgi:FixJ family two-component response regulator
MSLQPPTVFLLDDEVLVRKAVGRLLRAEGFEVAAFVSPVTSKCTTLDRIKMYHAGTLVF